MQKSKKISTLKILNQKKTPHRASSIDDLPSIRQRKPQLDREQSNKYNCPSDIWKKI